MTYLGRYLYIHTCVTTIKGKEAMDLKESGTVGTLEKRKGEGK